MTGHDAAHPAADPSVTASPNEPLRRIGEVAETVGLSLRTVRFYEEAGLVVPVKRTSGGFRLYDDDCIQRFRIIMQMKPLGFTVEEMRLLIEARAALAGGDLDDATRADLLERRDMFATLAEEKVRSLREQLAIAEGFSAQLSEEVDRDRRPDPGRGTPH